MKEKIDYKKLINAAFKAQKFAHAPYSNFYVGASVLTKSGKIYGGANIENASYPCGICAERVAMGKAVSEGEKEFEAVAIVSSGADYTYPCGLCRQFLSEFGNLKVVVANSLTDYKVHNLSELLPYSFSSADLDNNN